MNEEMKTENDKINTPVISNDHRKWRNDVVFTHIFCIVWTNNE